jgi:protein-L-isoaspartate(D-aspartate) O-methyltransferase
MSLTEAASLAERLRTAVANDRVLAAVASMPRDRFVPEAERHRAYENVALPIDCDQTISQPLVVARMLEALDPRPEDRVLDIGTGSGYHAALLALLARHVWTVERHPELSAQAARAIAGLGLDNVTFVITDGGGGLPSEGPFDAINVAAATNERVAAALEGQLAAGGRMVVPVGRRRQHLVRVTRAAEGVVRERLEAVRFVPLVRDVDGG